MTMTTEWIEVNLPLSDTGQEPVYPKAPNLDDEMRREFGMSRDDVETILDGPLQALFDSDWREFDNPINLWLDSGHPAKVEYARTVLTRKEIIKWEARHPEMIAHANACQAARLVGTFEGLGLRRPGVQIEMADGKRYLLGDVNVLGGLCDDCTAFEETDIVARYRVLVDPSDL